MGQCVNRGSRYCYSLILSSPFVILDLIDAVKPWVCLLKKNIHNPRYEKWPGIYKVWFFSFSFCLCLPLLFLSHSGLFLSEFSFLSMPPPFSLSVGFSPYLFLSLTQCSPLYGIWSSDFCIIQNRKNNKKMRITGSIWTVFKNSEICWGHCTKSLIKAKKNLSTKCNYVYQ